MTGYNIIRKDSKKEEDGVKEYTFAQKYRVYKDGRMFPVGGPFPLGDAKKIMPTRKPKREKLKATSPTIGAKREL